jgi:hypothetical protein
MEVKRKGLLLTFDKLDAKQKDGLRSIIADFIRIESVDVYAKVWEMRDGSYLIDVYCESKVVVGRLEEFLNAHGFVVRLTPKRVQVD